jgi:hypothetical protein
LFTVRVFAADLSTRTPLNFFAAFFFLPGRFKAINSPEFLLRLVHALVPPNVVLVCDRFFTAPLRALSPVALFTAMFFSRSDADFRCDNAEESPKFPGGNDPASAMRRISDIRVEIWETSAGDPAS